jgi:hypothetical protein
LDDKLLQGLEDKSLTKGRLHQIVEDDLELIPVLVRGMYSQKPSIRYGCGKVLMDLSEIHPKEVYPHIDSFIELLDSKFRITKWNSMAIIANITTIDKEKKIDSILEQFFSFLRDEYIVTVANAIKNLGKIALAKPYLIQEITDEILKVEKIELTAHITEECRRIIAEQAIRAFDLFFENINEKKKVLSFVERQLHSSRKSLRSKAADFVRKHCEQRDL